MSNFFFSNQACMNLCQLDAEIMLLWQLFTLNDCRVTMAAGFLQVMIWVSERRINPKDPSQLSPHPKRACIPCLIWGTERCRHQQSFEPRRVGDEEHLVQAPEGSHLNPEFCRLNSMWSSHSSGEDHWLTSNKISLGRETINEHLFLPFCALCQHMQLINDKKQSLNPTSCIWDSVSLEATMFF